MTDSAWFWLILLALVIALWRWFAARPAPTPRSRPPHRPPPWKPLPPEEIARRKQDKEEDRLDRIEAQRQAAEEKRLKEEQDREDSFDRVAKANAEEEDRRRRQRAREAMDTKVGREFQHYINQPIPKQIQRSMDAYRSGEFIGADRSPLAYVGYHVGKTNGLPPRDREQRLLVCFRIDIPRDLIGDYRDWAGPASRQRLGKMRAHLRMLSAMRRDRPGYEVAIAEWDRDRDWLQREVGTLAETFDRHGVTW